MHEVIRRITKSVGATSARIASTAADRETALAKGSLDMAENHRLRKQVECHSGQSACVCTSEKRVRAARLAAPGTVCAVAQRHVFDMSTFFTGGTRETKPSFLQTCGPHQATRAQLGSSVD